MQHVVLEERTLARKKLPIPIDSSGGANLSDINKGLSTSLIPILPPLFKPRENQSAILDTLAYLLSNQ